MPAAEVQSLDEALQAFGPAFPLGVAYSGGADSSALLHACQRRWPGQVVALHVHHGLQAAADGFEQHCRTACEQLGVPLRVQRVQARGAAGDSPEDAARRARYTALAEMAAPADGQGALAMVLVAQHADDQIETLLLALSRGAGLPGLSAMPPAWERHGVQFRRPLLGVSAADIRAWLAERGISFIEDPTNAHQTFTRNRIRHTLLPALDAAFPGMRDTFARSAAHCAQAQLLLDGLAEEDLQQVRLEAESLSIAALQGLPHARQANLLRHWLKAAHGVMPSAAQLAELQRLLAACTTRGHGIHLKVGQGFVRRSGDGIDWYNP